MEFVGWGLFILGCLACIVTGIMIMIKAFQTSIVWGLCYLFIPFASLAFCIMHWQKVGKLFLICLAATFSMYGGAFMAGIDLSD